MRKSSRVALGGLALALSSMSNPASAASTAGWNQADRSAATIREFQTRLMVAALRCRAAGIDVLASYNQFIAADRAEITAANDRLKAHFASINSVTGDRDYDRYTTSLANSFAGEQWSPQSCDAAAGLAREAAQTRGNLLAVAARDSSAEIASASSSPWAAYDRSVARDDGDHGPAPGYDGGYNDGWQAQQAYEDRAAPPGYYDRGAPRYREGSWRDQADDDRGPPPGYYEQGPSPADDDRGPPPGYDPRGYGY